MPILNLAIGQMDLSGDESSKKDTVLAQLYNGYRSGNAIHGIPGYAPFVSLIPGNAVTDGLWYSTLHNILLAASLGRMWRISRDGSYTEILGVSITPGVQVSFAETGTKIYFVADSLINEYEPFADIATQLTGDAPRHNSTIAFISGFLITDGQDATGTGVPGDIWYSDSENFNEWEVFNNESVPDRVQSIFVTFSEVYAIGSESIEVNYLSGDPNNPFAVNKAASQPFGTPARYSVAFDNESIYYLTVIGEGRKIVKLVGGRTPQILSFTLDVPVDDIEDVSTARGWIQSWKGESFYVITFPDANIIIQDQVHESITLAYNIKLEEWYIWGEWFTHVGEYRRYPVDYFVYVEPWGKRLVGYSGVIYELSGHSFNGGIIRPAIRTGWRNWGTMRQKACHQYIYNIKRGVGTLIEEPIMQHRWRNDGNAEWRLPRHISLGKVGDRLRPKYSYQCGIYIERQDEFIFPDDAEVVFNGVEEEITVGK